MSLNAAALRLMAAKGLTLEDVAEIAEAMEADKASSSAAARQKRYRDRKRNERDVTRDVTAPPKEDIQTPSSVPTGTVATATDPVKELFDVGISVLTAVGHTERQARSLVGKWRQSHGDGPVLAALVDCRTRSIANPVEWMPKRLAAASTGPPSFLDHLKAERSRQPVQEAQR